MTSVFVSCPFEDCKHFGKIEYIELARFRRHLAQEHKGEYWTAECKLILKKLAIALDSGLIVN